MNARTVVRMLVVVVTSALLLILFETGLAAGEVPELDGPKNQLEQGTIAAPESGSPCDEICDDDGCEVITPWDPIVITDSFVIYPFHSCLCENGDGSLRVEGEGGFFLPNLPVYGGRDSLYVKFVAQVSPALEPVCVHFTGTSAVGIPIGQSGFALTYLEGEATLEPEPMVRVKGTIESQDESIPPYLRPVVSPLVSGTGEVEVDLKKPYAMSFDGTVAVLTLEAVQAAMTIDQSWGMGGSAYITVPVCHGDSYIHVWKESNGAYGFTGSASLTCALTKGSLNPDWWEDIPLVPDLPPTDIATATAQAEVGRFCLGCEQGMCTEEFYGVLAGVGLDLPSLPGVEPGMITARFFVSPTDITSVTTNLELCAVTNQAAVVAEALHEGRVLEDIHEVKTPVKLTELAIFAVEWERGHPDVSLVEPYRTELGQAAAVDHEGVGRVSAPTSTVFVVRDPEPGQWQVKLTDLNGDEGYTVYLVCLNAPPTMTITSPSSAEEEGADSYTIHYEAEDPDDEVEVSLYYDRDGVGHDGRLIARCLDDGEGSHVWDTSEVKTGTYHVYGRIDDGKNFPVVAYSAGTVQVEDSTPPVKPHKPTLSIKDERMGLSWEDNPEDDVVGYHVRDGDVQTFDATNVLSFRLPYAMPEQVSLRIRAYDSSGNVSAWSDPVHLAFVYLPVLLRGLD